MRMLEDAYRIGLLFRRDHTGPARMFHVFIAPPKRVLRTLAILHVTIAPKDQHSATPLRLREGD